MSEIDDVIRHASEQLGEPPAGAAGAMPARTDGEKPTGPKGRLVGMLIALEDDPHVQRQYCRNCGALLGAISPVSVIYVAQIYGQSHDEAKVLCIFCGDLSDPFVYQPVGDEDGEAPQGR